jgi:hypothetical protein
LTTYCRYHPWHYFSLVHIRTQSYIQGILESGREELQRARAFLLAALQAHEQLAPHLPPPSSFSSTGDFRRPLQGPYTHSLFYLAQVHGALGDAKASAGYCYRTLAEQVSTEGDDRQCIDSFLSL